MKTEKLFYTNTYTREFTANIVDAFPYNKNYAVILDRTAFYPEGGGQPGDTGRLNDSTVLDTVEKDGEILHIVDAIPGVKEVKGCLNWERRFDHMQQHTGQHILSACFAKIMNGGTDSFHMGRDIVTIEIGISNFTESDALYIERMANDVIYNNLPITAEFVDNNRLSTIPLRKKPAVTENIRIVEVKEFDYSPCGGTHVNHSGEVGIIKIKKWERLKASYRIEFLCGYRALKDYVLQNSISLSLCEKLSVRDYEIIEAFDKLNSDYRSIQKQLQASQLELLKHVGAEMMRESREIGTVKVVSEILDNKSIDDAKIMAQQIVREPGYIVMLVCKNKTVQVVFSRSDDIEIDMNRLLKSLLPIIEGKGGGNTKAAQGGGSKLESAEKFLNTAVKTLEISLTGEMGDA
jgi:alanyl-tRNA synthetase